MSVSITMNNLVKRYGGQTVIPGLSLDVRNGELFTLLGPSGCGKTTLLRMIAGFNSVDGGELCFDGRPIMDVPAHRRNIGMVFQNYAIFPNMSVRKNVEYGFRARKVPRDEVRRRVDEILDVVRIREYQDRMPAQLSGGQLQRVALARAIVIHPSVLLMDEPLSNLDAKLRLDLRGAIRDVQKQVGITTCYVTHDQEEALAISDRIAVMDHGVIQQVGTPMEIYARPANGFVATFIGRSGLFGAVAREDCLEFADGSRVPLPVGAAAAPGQRVALSIRPEELSPADTGLRAMVRSRTFLGKTINYVLEFAGGVALPGYPPIEYAQDFTGSCRMYEPGEVLFLQPDLGRVNVFTEDLSRSLMEGGGGHG